MDTTTLTALGDQLRIGRYTGLLNQLPQANQRPTGIVGMHRPDAARMSRIPCLEQRQGAFVADFSHDDAIGPQPHRCAQQSCHIGRVRRAQKDDIAGGDLELARIFDDDDTMVRIEPSHAIQDRIRQRRLARPRSTAD